MLTLTLPIGVAVSLLLVELTGLSAGGIVTPAYIALILDRPLLLALTAAIAALTWASVAALSRQLFLYGRRRFSVTILIGVTLSATAHLIVFGPANPPELAAFGFIIPGLVAHQVARQGLWPTLALIAIAAPLVRLIALGLVTG